MCELRLNQNLYGNYSYQFQSNFPFIEKRGKNHHRHEEFFNESESLRWIKECHHCHHYLHQNLQEQPLFGCKSELPKEKYPNHHNQNRCHHQQHCEYQSCKPFKSFKPYGHFAAFAIPFKLQKLHHREGQLCGPFQSFRCCRQKQFSLCVPFRRQIQYKFHHHNSHYYQPCRQYPGFGKQRHFEERKHIHHQRSGSFKSLNRFRQFPKFMPFERQVNCGFRYHNPYHGLQCKQCPCFGRLPCEFRHRCYDISKYIGFRSQTCIFNFKQSYACQQCSPCSGFKEKKCDHCRHLPCSQYKFLRHHCERKEKTKTNQMNHHLLLYLTYQANLTQDFKY